MVKRCAMWVLAVAALAVCASAAEERYTYEFAPLEFFMDVGKSAFDTFASNETKANYTFYTADQMRLLMRTLSGSLDGDSMEELAVIQPQVRDIIQYLKRTPFMGDYADWLETRADYFDEAFETQEAAKRAKQQAQQQAALRPPAPPPVEPGTRRVAPPPASQIVRKEDVVMPVRTNTVEASAPARMAPPPTIPRPELPEKTVTAPVAAPKTPVATAMGYQEEKERWIKRLAGRPVPADARKYADHLRRIFVAEGVPGALVWQAEVESNFHPHAKSPAGALGMYQFMPGTAQQYGLSLSPKDERLDPEKSARAAAQYLKFLHRKFGSWELALAAYNCGEGRLQNALKGAQDPTFSGIRHKLPVETRMYIPKIAAVLQLRENVDLATL